MRGSPFRLVCLLTALLSGCEKRATADEAPAPKPPPPIAHTVHFTRLSNFLPNTIDGFEQVKDEGSTGKYGEVVVSEAERVFQQKLKGREVSVRIVDTTVAARLAKAISAAAKDAEAREEDALTGPLTLSNAVGFVRFDEGQDRAEANLLVGDRYVVAVTTVGYPDTRELRRFTRELDLAGLSKLR